MKNKLLLIYGLFLGWVEIILRQVFTYQPQEQLIIFFILIPLIAISVLLSKKSIIDIKKINILWTTGFCVILMLVYYSLFHIVPNPLKYLLTIIFLFSFGLMTILIFVSFKYYSYKVLSLSDGIKTVAVILFVNTTVTMIYEIFLHLNMSLLNGIMLLLILGVYYWYFSNNKKAPNTYSNTLEITVPMKLLFLVSALMFLLSIGYGPFLNSIRGKVISHYPYAYINVRLAYLISLGSVYIITEKIKEYIEFFMMLFTAIIVITHLLLSLFNGPLESFILCLVIQFSYAWIHCIIGGLVVMIGYLYKDTAKNIAIIIILAFSAVILGNILPNVFIGNISLNLLVAIISFVMAMVFYMFIPKEILLKFEEINKKIVVEKNKIIKLQQIKFYDTLTPREREVMSYLVQNYTNKVIAEKLEISENTLKRHAKNIYSKLYVKNKRELKDLLN